MHKKVLIIEDDIAICKEKKYSLQNETTDVYYAPSVAEGFEVLTKYHFCLVIMDIHLSETDGVELLKMIRQTKRMPILVLSSKAGSMKRIEALRAITQPKVWLPLW